jgi:glutathione peroxidase-family protein
MFAKINVNPGLAPPLYKYLRRSRAFSRDGGVKWNHPVLVGTNGAV